MKMILETHSKLLCFLGLFSILVTTVSGDSERLLIPETLKRFLGTLEKYEHTRNDVVFLLDESGSIGVDKFKEVLSFTKLIARRLSVKSESSRVAVVTFATDTISHVNYIKDPDGNNMCSLLPRIDKIGYVAEWTHTSKAMKEAERILTQARPNSNKIIILLTDGESNDGYSPLSIARDLKSKGIIIFAVGVASVNEKEIYGVATSVNHTYILTNFNLIEKINIKLVQDLNETALDLAKDPSLCSVPCDNNALCYCGARSGNYECVCNAGYSGVGGLKNQCQKCPRGTFKTEPGNAFCTACPEHSTTRNEGSIDFRDCECDPGYEKYNNTCTPVKCAILSAPEGGVLIPSHCNNVYGSQCSFRCNEGYCPFSCNAFYQFSTFGDHDLLPSRTCLDTGKWSGEEFLCERMTCPALSFPKNGDHNCTRKDFTHGTTCSFTCEKGFTLSGSHMRTCLFGGWTGDEVKCKEITCDKLKVNALLQVRPPTCASEPKPFRSVCTYYCVKGYDLIINGNKTDGVLKCKADKKWSLSQDKITCKDIEPPSITCPKSITVVAEPHKPHAEVQWDEPNATDNVFVHDIQRIEPKHLIKSNKPNHYIINITKVNEPGTKITYEARDISKLTHSCSFLVKVIDKEPPQLVMCPPDIKIYHDSNKAIPVTWKGPIFKDNSGFITVTSNRTSGDEFSWGPPSVVHFNATDPSGNTASCSFSVKIKPSPCPYYNPPENGVMTCDNWNDGRFCSIFCHEGFQFAAGQNFDGVYMCRKVVKNGQVEWKWAPFHPNQPLKLPWPDCSRKQLPPAFNVSVGVSYTVDSCSEAVLNKMREKFFSKVENISSIICPKSRGCAPENVKVTCNAISARRKRSHKSDVDTSYQKLNYKYETRFHRIVRDTEISRLTVNFDLVLSLNDVQKTSNINTTNIPENVNEMISNSVVKELEERVSLQVKDAYNLTTIPKSEVNYGVIALCSLGQITVNNSCVNCPVGTYKDDISETCIDCPQATYQDEERQLSCKPCPIGYTTYEVKSKSRSDCKGPCQPGTYSNTTFEPCFTCPLNTYQDRTLRKECLKCPTGLYTWRVGANSSTDCVAPCKPGSFSDTGFEPCSLCELGTFQELEKQKSCSVCPNGTSTKVKGSKSVENCKEIDICNELRPCQYGSECIQLDKDYECICPDGLIGKNCEINFDDCDSEPCLNNGTCIDGIGNFTCSCLDGFTGHRCEVNQDDCVPNPCLNGGKCIDKVNAYDCQCLPGFVGDRCERNIYECESNPCQNNGTCFDKQNGYRCCCPKGYFGLNCEEKQNISFCTSVVCQNGGTCLEDESMFTCDCQPGFEGEFCEHNINDCENLHCDNGGLCVDGIENATCSCPPKYTGLHCEKALIPEFLLRFPTPTVLNYAEIENKNRLPSITVAFFMRTSFTDPNSRATPVSYSYRYQNQLVDNALTLLNTNNFILYIQGQEFHTEYKANRDSEWHHYAVTWEKNSGKWLFYVDSKVIASGNAGENKYMHAGTFVLGQEQDDVGGRFSTLEAFSGDITEFNVWDYALTEGEIGKISSSCGYTGNVIPWYVISQSVYGNVVLKDVDKCKALGTCPENSCDCFYSNGTEDYLCKFEVRDCEHANTCLNFQPCISNELHSFCNCSKGFEGRRCEYDVDECLDENGGCSHICVNGILSGFYHCECPADMVLSEDGKTCKDKSYCMKDEQVYLNGEAWVDACQNCICNDGIISCEEIVCNVTECHPEETLLTSPGECCPKCVAWSFCLVSSHNTVTSFDLSMYHLEGECMYTVVEDCIEGSFKVVVESPHGKNETNVIIYQDCKKVVVSSDGKIIVDDNIVTLPFQNEEFIVEDVNSTITVMTNSDLLVQWNFIEELVIGVPITKVNKMCGVCSKIEEYYVYGSGRFPLSERYVSGENECFIRSEGFGENSNSGSFSPFLSKVLPVLVIVFCLLLQVKLTEV